jgi:ribonuclease HI
VKLKVGLGRGSNNFAELMVLKLSLILAAERGVSCLQVFGDSLLVRNWMNGRNQLKNFLLQPVLDEFLAIKSSLTEVTFKHI